jgi:peptidoglycan/xylan/chitin deacetylase (PgdA/CDA1 family)
MDAICRDGRRGVGVSAWADDALGSTPAVVITFDDGCETDLIAAAPILRERGFGATCYLTVDWLGQRGFLSLAQARELAQKGIEIGCHSMSHAYLSDIDDAALDREIVQAKDRLEQICGVAVRSLSCPGGRYDSRVLPRAHAAGYDTITTSRAGPNSRGDRHAILGRFAIIDSTSMEDFGALLQGRGLLRQRLRASALLAAKAVLGNHLYERMRSRMLGHE